LDDIQTAYKYTEDLKCLAVQTSAESVQSAVNSLGLTQARRMLGWGTTLQWKEWDCRLLEVLFLWQPKAHL